MGECATGLLRCSWNENRVPNVRIVGRGARYRGENGGLCPLTPGAPSCVRWFLFLETPITKVPQNYFYERAHVLMNGPRQKLKRAFRSGPSFTKDGDAKVLFPMTIAALLWAWPVSSSKPPLLSLNYPPTGYGPSAQ